MAKKGQTFKQCSKEFKLKAVNMYLLDELSSNREGIGKGLSVNHKRVYRMMKELNLRSIIRKKRRAGRNPAFRSGLPIHVSSVQ